MFLIGIDGVKLKDCAVHLVANNGLGLDFVQSKVHVDLDLHLLDTKKFKRTIRFLTSRGKLIMKQDWKKTYHGAETGSRRVWARDGDIGKLGNAGIRGISRWLAISVGSVQRNVVILGCL